jgi:hypothetical protein
LGLLLSRYGDGWPSRSLECPHSPTLARPMPSTSGGSLGRKRTMAHDLLRVVGMSEVEIDLTNDPPDPVDSCRFGATDHLAITRLAPVAPAPKADLTPARPPSLFGPSSTPNPGRDGAPLSASSNQASEGRRSKAPEPRTRFWRARLRPTMPSASVLSGQRPLDLLIAAAGSGLGLIAIAIAVFIGVREQPSDPTVSAAVVVAHAWVALALIGFGLRRLGIAERRAHGRRRDGVRRTPPARDAILGRQQERTG